MSIEIKRSKQFEKDFAKAPKEIQERVIDWVKQVLTIGLEATRQQGGNGLHDEALRGHLKGVRSVRLNKAWRLFYSIDQGKVQIITIVAVNKHDYR